MRNLVFKLSPLLVLIVILATACQSSATSVPQTATPTSHPTSTPWPVLGPDANDDRVGFPEGYETDFKTFYVFDRPDNQQVRVVYANDAAASSRPGEPFPYGSILVMETYRAVQDEQGNVMLDEDGRFQREDLRGIFVMRKEPGFGTRYQEQRTGEWEYVAFRPDRTYQTEPKDAVRCAACHTDAGPSRDWVYRANLFFTGTSGALPELASDHPSDQIIINSYLYLPETVRVKLGTEVTWHNNDQVPHTVTASDGSFSGLVQQGTTFQTTFSEAGTFEYFCAIHPDINGQVIVEE
jgi:hemoglobin